MTMSTTLPGCTGGGSTPSSHTTPAPVTLYGTAMLGAEGDFATVSTRNCCPDASVKQYYDA